MSPELPSPCQRRCRPRVGQWTAGGQTSSQGGDYSLGGTIGQPDAGVLSGGEYTLGGRFWRGGAEAEAEAAYRT